MAFAGGNRNVAGAERLATGLRRKLQRFLLQRGELVAAGEKILAAADQFCAGGSRRLLDGNVIPAVPACQVSSPGVSGGSDDCEPRN